MLYLMLLWKLLTSATRVLEMHAGLKGRNEYSARPQRGLHRKNVPVTSSNVVEDHEEDERCISEEDFDPTNWNS